MMQAVSSTDFPVILSRYRAVRVVLAALRLSAFLLLIVVLTPLHLVMVATSGSMAVPRLFHKICRRIFGIRLRHIKTDGQAQASAEKSQGKSSKNKNPVFYVSNHVSYLDIILLGGVFDAVFVAKSDVADWPLFGVLAKLQKTVFIRRVAQGIDEGRGMIAARLARGYSVILFPEGTSTDGRAVVPFKSALFSLFTANAAAERAAGQEGTSQGEGFAETPIVPLCIRIRSVEGIKPSEHEQEDNGPRGLYGWYGDMVLVPHLWRFSQVFYTEIDLIEGAAVLPSAFASRKDMASFFHTQVSNALHAE